MLVPAPPLEGARQPCTPIEIVTDAAVALPHAARVSEVAMDRRLSASSSSHARRRGHSRKSASCATSTVPSVMVSNRSSESRLMTGSPRRPPATACGDARTLRPRARPPAAAGFGAPHRALRAQAARRHPPPGARPRRAPRRSARTPRRSTAGRRDAARGRAGRSTAAEAHPARRPRPRRVSRRALPRPRGPHARPASSIALRSSSGRIGGTSTWLPTKQSREIRVVGAAPVVVSTEHEHDRAAAVRCAGQATSSRR